jgi:hypothetical protein
MAIAKLPANRIFRFIVGDFESAWAALAATKGRIARGNFMFALLAMILLEFACRVCEKDNTKKKLADLTQALTAIDRRYFTPLPGRCAQTSEFTLPGAYPDSNLLAMIFDLVRNGKAHQYQSAVLALSDGEVDLDLTGATMGRALTKPGRRRPTKHLRFKVSASGDLSLYIRTDQLFLDVKQAIENSGIISPSDVVSDIIRPRLNKKGGAPVFYNFSVSSLRNSLSQGCHLEGTW